MSLLHALAFTALLAIAAHAAAPKSRAAPAVEAHTTAHAIPDAQIHAKARRYL